MAEPIATPPEDEEVIDDQEVIDQPAEPVVDNEQEDQEIEEEPPEEPEEPEPAQPSRRKELRLQKLVEKLRGPQSQPAPQDEEHKGLDYRTALDAEDDVINQLEEDRKTYGTNQYQAGLKQAQSLQFHTRLEIDAPRVASKYSILDKESNDFHPVVANALNESYLSMVGFDSQTGMVQNGNVRYADYVEGMMELANEIASQTTAKSAKNIAKQSATTGLRPDGSAPRMNLNKLPHQMTDAELDAVIAQSIPKH